MRMILCCHKGDQWLSKAKRHREGWERAYKEETLGGVIYAHYLDCGDGSTCVHMYQDIKLYILNIQLNVCQLYLNKAIK